MELERVFDLALHMRDNKGEDYTFDKKKGIVLNYRQQGVVVHKSIQAYMQGVGCKVSKEMTIQAFTGSSTLPTLTKDVFNVTQAAPIFDLLWQAAFRGIPLRKGQLAWEIADVSSGLTYKLIPEGGKVDFYGVTGDTETVGIQKYGAGLGITWETMEGKKLYAFVDQMMQARSRLYKLWANIHYGLLNTAAALNATTWQGAATDPVIDRDIATINLAYQTIGNACKAKGYGDMANVPMILYAPPSLKARIMQAFRATTADMIRGRHSAAATGVFAGQIIEFNITPYFSWNSNLTAAKAAMILPGNKIQNSMYMQELGLSEKDIETLSELRTYWTAFGGIVADTDQCNQLSFA